MPKYITKQTRKASLSPATFNEEDQTVELTFSTGAEGIRRNFFGESFIESLSMDKKHVRLGRLNNGAPLIATHNDQDLNAVIGVVEQASVDGQTGRALVRFSKREDVQPIIQDVKDGILRNISIGYQVHKFEHTENENGPDHFRAIDWEPMEISIVPIGFDDGAKIRSQEPLNEVEIVSLTKEPVPQVPTIKKEGPMDFEELVAKRYNGETLSTEENKFVDLEIKKRAQQEAEAKTTQVVTEKVSKDAELNANQRFEDGKKTTIQIHSQCRTAGLSDEDAIDIAENCKTIDEANAEIVKRYVQKSKESSPEIHSHIEVQDNKDDTNYIDAVTNSLLNRSNPSRFELTEDGRQFRGNTLVDHLKQNLDKNHISYRGLAPTEIMRRGLMTTSDFPIILENVANKVLRDAYTQIPQTFRPLVNETSAPDFKPLTRVQIGDAPKLLKVNEHGEFTHGTMTEGKESYQLKTYGRLLGMTRQMLINDDLGGFTRVANSWGRSASELESEVVWNLITSNPLMGDGKNVFHADHGNLQAVNATKGKLDLTNLAAARRAMRLKQSLEGKRLNLSARYLVVSSLYETEAEKLLAPVVPNKNEDVNIFANRFEIIVESLLDDFNENSWFMVAPPSTIDGIEIAYLDGERGVQLDRQEGFAIDGVQFKARLDFGAAFIDHRGWYKNEGVA